MLSAADEVRYTQRGIPVSNGKLAMWLFLVTEIMFFTGLIGTYIVLRMSTPKGGWPDPTDVHLNEYWGAINTFVLIFSSFTVVMAHSALGRGDSKKCVIYIAVTFVMGCVFMGIKAWEYTAKFQHGIMPGRMGDNLIDPALRQIDPTQPGYERFQEGKLAHYRNEAGKHPYDPNAARAYKAEVKAKLTAAGKPVLDEIKALDDAAAEAKKPVDAAAREAIFARHIRNAEAVNAAKKEKQAVDKDRDEQRKAWLAYDLVSRINGERGGRAISALEVGVEANDLNHEYEKLHLPPFIQYGNLWSSSYFAMTGFHAIHVLGGLVVFAIILIHGLRGKLVKNAWNVSMMELTGLYWHFVDVVWIFLFPLLYLV